MPVQLPLVPSEANYRMGTSLGGTQYLLDVRWNARAEAWYMDISTEDDVAIHSGIKLVLGAALGGTSVDPDFPDGLLIVSDLSGAGLDAGFDDMGVRVAVYFYTAEELSNG